jgi:hypothetical protein
MSLLRLSHILDQRRALAAVGLAVVAFAVYNANMRSIGAGDTFPARYLPLSFWRTGTLHLERFDTEMNTGHGLVYWTLQMNGHEESAYPIVTPVLIAPLYAPAAYYLSRTGWDIHRVKAISGVMEKLCASLIAAASVAVIYLVLLGIASPRTALILTIAYAFGTNTWVTSSQALWQHGLGELLLATVLYAAGRAVERPRWSIVAGLCCALMAFNRPGDGMMVIAVSAYFLQARTWKPFLIPAAALSAALLGYNVVVYGAPTGGYAYLNPYSFAFDTFPNGVAGLLVSPAKGLFVFSPFLLLLIAVSPWRFCEAGQKRLAALLIAGLISEIIVYGRTQWDGGFCFGPRYFSGLLPAMIWLIAPLAGSMRRPLRFAFVALIAVAIGVQAAGAFFYPSSGIDEVYRHEHWTLWHPLYNTVIRDIRAGRMPPTLFDDRK